MTRYYAIETREYGRIIKADNRPIADVRRWADRWLPGGVLSVNRLRLVEPLTVPTGSLVHPRNWGRR